jgi:hypothetical protein
MQILFLCHKTTFGLCTLKLVFFYGYEPPTHRYLCNLERECEAHVMSQVIKQKAIKMSLVCFHEILKLSEYLQVIKFFKQSITVKMKRSDALYSIFTDPQLSLHFKIA